MNRVEYLQEMQKLREQQQGNAKKNREILDMFNKEHIERLRNENDYYKEVMNKQRDEHTARQHDIERRMNDLKKEWAREHPIEEVKVIE